MTEEDSCDLDSSSEEDDTFSHDDRSEQYVPHRKANVSTGDSIDRLGDRYAPWPLPQYVCHCKDDRRARSPRSMNRHPQRPCFVHKPREICCARTASDVNMDEVLSLLPGRQRKTRQQLQREKEAAVTLQSAWRGCQVRKDISKMNKAATQIQAAFRGYMTRKELPLGLCGYGRTNQRKLQKKTRAEDESKPFPALLDCLQQFGLVSGTKPSGQSISLPNGKPRNYSRNLIEDYPLLNPNVTFFEIESTLRPNREVFTYTSFNVFATGIQDQRYEDAATTIQAAWRGYQIRQKGRPMTGEEKRPRNPICSNFAMKKTPCKHSLPGPALKGPKIRQIFVAKADLHDTQGTLSLRDAPQIRNINIYAVIKAMPDPSRKPNISIRVLSPNAVVQGYEREMSSGVQALYTVQNNSASMPSQILIHVNTQKRKDVLLKTEKKKQKP
ncbi:neuronal acetylcholine receptor subunit beta-3 isoform X1 [Podarcis lilfordi]|uniref:Neuronal acetylcholine receptor subunit beta-3 isoform X1 n=1 Tax=Podarcis lilfordi TaxID=74358 RepID=A0AA35PSY3_9SAUR|nr:neuronal acetylcholine receptor subunit beta-3 isoform X1 [Podarcis lilfordi]